MILSQETPCTLRWPIPQAPFPRGLLTPPNRTCSLGEGVRATMPSPWKQPTFLTENADALCPPLSFLRTTTCADGPRSAAVGTNQPPHPPLLIQGLRGQVELHCLGPSRPHRAPQTALTPSPQQAAFSETKHTMTREVMA